MNDNRAVFARYKQKFILMHIAGNRAEHIYVYPDLSGQMTGNIINCRIEKQAGNIGSSFVMYDAKKTGFINRELKCQSVMPLMFKNEAYNEKKARFTDALTIDGQYVVATDKAGFVKASSKIAHDEKENLIRHFSECPEKYGMGIILRTKVYTEEDGIKKAEEEIENIRKKFDEIEHKAAHSPQYTVLYRPVPQFIKDLLYLADQGIEEIVTDDEEISEAVSAGYDGISGTVSVTDRVGLRFYEDKLLSLCNLYSFNAKISEAMSRNVYLKSGAYITFDPGEALCAIDINTSGTDAKSGREDTFLSVNMEAAEEIARQLRLRNISGIIIIDYINMRSDEDYEKLASCMKKAFASDRSGCRFVDFTELKLAEVVRQRHGLTLYSSLRS